MNVKMRKAIIDNAYLGTSGEDLHEIAERRKGKYVY